MKLAATIQMHKMVPNMRAVGDGSGCTSSNCGTHAMSGKFKKVKEQELKTGQRKTLYVAGGDEEGKEKDPKAKPAKKWKLLVHERHTPDEAMHTIVSENGVQVAKNYPAVIHGFLKERYGINHPFKD